MQLSIIIVSWNVRDYLRQCLDSIFRFTTHTSFEVIVIDNASTDGSAAMVTASFPNVQLITNQTNRGFGAANNQGLKVAQGDYVLFLNDDTEIKSDIFPALLEKFSDYAKTGGKLGMLGCRLVNADGTLQASVRAYPTWFDQTVTLLKLHHAFPHLLDTYLCTKFDYTQEQTVDQIMGAFMLSPRQLMLEQAGFDEGFFVWFEEVDLQKRLHNLGYTILYTPIVSCTHIKGQSFGQLRKPAAQKMFNVSMRRYFWKHCSRLSYAVICSFQPISIMMSYVLQAVR